MNAALGSADRDAVREAAFAQGRVYALHAGSGGTFALDGSLRVAPSTDPAGLLLLRLTSMLLTCGTRRRDEFGFAAQLEDRGASLWIDAEPGRIAFSASARSADLPTIVALLAECLREPRFSADAFHAARMRMIAELRALSADPAALAMQGLTRLLYPPSHLRHEPAPADAIALLENVALDDVRRCHREHFGANALRIAVAGDIEAEVLAGEAARAFAGWTASPPSSPTAAIDDAATTMQTGLRIPAPDGGHFAVALGHRLSPRCDHPDYAALWLANRVLGAGFASRLVVALRERRGLTYSIRSQLSKPDPGFDGHWQVGLSLGAEMLEAGLAATRAEIARFVEGGVDAHELEICRREAIGAFRIGLATLSGLSETLLFGAECGWGAHYAQAFPQHLQAIDRDRIQRVVAEHLRPDQLRTAIAGPFEA
jgi:predicted Zn-dependent peptidase